MNRIDAHIPTPAAGSETNRSAEQISASGTAQLIASPARRRSWLWPGIVFILLGAQLVMMIVSVVLATRDPSFAVEPNYYQQSLNWDEHAAQLRTSALLGWRIAPQISSNADVAGRRRFEAQLADRDDRPLDGATIEVTFFPHARGEERTQAALAPQGEGRYTADLTLRRAGLWEFRFVVRKGHDVFAEVQCLDLAAPTHSTGGSR